jgi:hypothetical protein
MESTNANKKTIANHTPKIINSGNENGTCMLIDVTTSGTEI